ncbi:MAG: DUF3006 domain-containing protein [Clostridiales bacterium]|nr:DUF3006 domain-containing protein [Clostridiales bacterium]
MLIIDRLEGDIAVCEDEERRMVEIPRRLLPADAEPGSVLTPDGEGYRLDAAAEAQRRERIRRLQDSLWEE